MNDIYLLGLDLGTTNAKAAVYDQRGKLIAESSAAYPTVYPQPGYAEQRPSDWTKALTVACRQMMAALGERRCNLVGMALAAHGPGLVLVDAQGQPLLDSSPTWQDTRCLAQAQHLLAVAGPYPTGMGLPHNTFLAKLLWACEQQPELVQRARFALGIKDYLVQWLTGQFLTEPSTNAGADAWPQTAVDACGWSVERLAQVVPSTSVIGPLLPLRTKELDLPAHLPVVIGLNDGASATFSMGALQPHEMALTLATSGVLRIVLAEPMADQTRLDHKLFAWPYVPGRAIAGGHLRLGASVLKWFAETHYSGQPEDELAAVLAEATTSAPGSRGVIFLPYLLGRGGRQANDDAKGAFLNLTLAHTRADMGRAILEGVAFAFRELLDDFMGMGYRPSLIRISGGGARSVLWRQILTDVLACPLAYFTADSTLGAAMMAAVGIGLYADCAAAAQAMVRPPEMTHPQAQTQSSYKAAYQEYQRLRDLLCSNVEQTV
ncbi:MAG: FGGY family carbohydrate kinase [Caldilineaceae bacterium]